MEILQDTSKHAMIWAIEQNFIDYRLLFSRFPQGCFYRNDEVSWLCSGIPYPSWNGVLEAHYSYPTCDQQIKDLVRQIKSLKFPASWWISPRSAPTDLPERLLRLKFEHVLDSSAMARVIEPGPLKIDINKNLVIREITISYDLDIYIKILKQSFQLPLYCVEALIDLFYYDYVSNRPVFRHFIGIMDDSPVAITSLFMAAGVAGIYFVGTVPSFRRRGIGTTMTAHCMNKAAETGIHIAVLRASRMGVPVYRHLGFEEYFRFRLFTINPAVFKPAYWKFSYYSHFAFKKFCGDTIWF